MRREDLPIICYGTPIVGLLVAAQFVENPAGNGPGALQVAVAAAIPVLASSFAARRVGLSWSATLGWAAKSAVGLAALCVLGFLFVALTFPGLS